MALLAIPYFCECNSTCHNMVLLPPPERAELLHEFFKAELVRIVIVDGCKYGPEPTDVLVEKRAGYSIYQEAVS